MGGSLTRRGTTAECVETAVKQTEPTVTTPIGVVVQLFVSETAHSKLASGVRLPVQQPARLMAGLPRCPGGASSVKFTVEGGELAAIPSETQTVDWVRTTGESNSITPNSCCNVTSSTYQPAATLGLTPNPSPATK